ncbi:type I-F CRISPR-associated protein Csy1 [Marinagarivorans algicola]|uniref:type I-F CRISPR-associated protein Csy1 n=1 Tax=Marinagarivorans algicola TaxID=1513270 RepID=UPI0006B662FA|nr:type I-F CRISPR-associated protein Csy1 [Marinagarivorans algicola]
MLDPSLQEFFDQRKKAWLKNKTKTSDSDEVLASKTQECQDFFTLASWLPSAAKRAGQISIATHPCTFSHPSARKNKNGDVTSVIANCPKHSDGYLRTGNVAVQPDALGNAAALDVYKFLNVRLSDEATVLEHIQGDTPQAQALLKIPTASYDELKQGFLAMVQSSAGEAITSSKIKQIYFPVAQGYHLLSVLTNSGILFELRQRLDTLRFSDDVKAKRALKKANEYSPEGYREIYDLTTIGYGGNNQQNISVFNNQNGGKAHLLASTPPHMQARDIRFPTSNFFTTSLNPWSFKHDFKYLHKVMGIATGGDIPRQTLLLARDNAIKTIVLNIMDTVHAVRAVASEQYQQGSALPAAQVIWLCHHKSDERENSDAWLEDIIHECVRWCMQYYAKSLGDKAMALGDTEFIALKQMMTQWAADNKDFLR